MSKDGGHLYIVPTPIGNLSDITIRALEILKSVDLILAEDTRTTRVLLKHYDINTPLKSYHIRNEHSVVNQWPAIIESKKNIALVSDAGTPGISDPGYLLVRASIDAKMEVVVLPGATALIPALISSGLPSDRFIFEGFLPHKKGRRSRLSSLVGEKRTILLYESPHRLLKTLTQLRDMLGDSRQVAVSREISKVYEETLRGSLHEIIDHFSKANIRGEYVIVISGDK